MFSKKISYVGSAEVGSVIPKGQGSTLVGRGSTWTPAVRESPLEE